jgi:hypothetical protein
MFAGDRTVITMNERARVEISHATNPDRGKRGPGPHAHARNVGETGAVIGSGTESRPSFR